MKVPQMHSKNQKKEKLQRCSGRAIKVVSYLVVCGPKNPSMHSRSDLPTHETYLRSVWFDFNCRSAVIHRCPRCSCPNSPPGKGLATSTFQPASRAESALGHFEPNLDSTYIKDGLSKCQQNLCALGPMTL